MIRVRKRVFYLKKEFRDQATNFIAARYDLLLVPATGDKGDDSQFTCDRDVGETIPRVDPDHGRLEKFGTFWTIRRPTDI